MKPGDSEYEEVSAATRATAALAAEVKMAEQQLIAFMNAMGLPGEANVARLNAWGKQLSEAFKAGDTERIVQLYKQPGQPLGECPEKEACDVIRDALELDDLDDLESEMEELLMPTVPGMPRKQIDPDEAIARQIAGEIEQTIEILNAELRSAAEEGLSVSFCMTDENPDGDRPGYTQIVDLTVWRMIHYHP